MPKASVDGRNLLLLVAPALLLLGLCLVIPMLGLVRVSFYPGSTSIGASGFSFAQYAKFLSDWFYPSVLLGTLLDGLIVTSICLVLGFPVGYSLARQDPVRRRLRMILVILPLTLSLVVIVFGWMVILSRGGLLNRILMSIGLFETPQQLLFNRPAVIVVLVQQFIPFMILSIMSVVSQIDPVLEQASASLRAGRLQTFRKVIFPLAAPGILAGSTLVFVLTISAFITPRLIGGAGTQMVGALIFEEVMASLNWPFAAAMSFLLLFVGLTISTVANRLVVKRMNEAANGY
ncbi:hypothetical protein XH97_02440 [Bradyrhizobium sp. CCBAU 53380]|nr:hypothetical protein [Bradyrhizobium sp. CCBAU 53380]